MRRALVAALDAILAGAPTEATVAALLREQKLDRAGRRRVARTLFRASILRLRLAHLAGQSDAAALLDALDALERIDAPGAAPPPDDRSDDARWPEEPVARLALEQSCPRWLVERLTGSLGLEGARAFLTASNLPGPKTLRVSPLRTTREELARALAEEGIATRPGELSPWALHVVEPDEDDAPRANLTASRAWRDGAFEIQDESSQLCALACGARPGHVVVDLCAGRGGKALALGAAMEDRGELWLHDIDDAALGHAEARLRRAGITCARRGLPAPGSADVVLVDAPCSALGPLRRSPDLRFTLAPERLEAFPETQRALLEEGLTFVKPGGRLVYATCTVLRAENEEVTRSAGLVLEQERTLLPHVEGCDGFYFAVGTRSG